jgi:N-acetyl-gamma-glutamyl-phosphate reductase
LANLQIEHLQAQSPATAQPHTKSVLPRIAVAGVSGYAGGELARLLLAHPRLAAAKPIFLGRSESALSEAEKPTHLSDLQPQLFSGNEATDPEIVPFSWERLESLGTNLLFLATPHEQSRDWVTEAARLGLLDRGLRIIDLSGAWRLDSPANSAVYKLHDADPALAQSLQAEAAYGCPELHRAEISKARIVANPGCYATSIILALAPLLHAGLADLHFGIIADAKSGVSGAGKAATAKTHFMYAADNLSAYAVFGHRHTGELLEQLRLTADQIQFTPHLLPIPRGILSTIYVRLNSSSTHAQIAKVFEDFYRDSPLVRVRPAGQLPQIQYIVRTNLCDLGFELSPDGKRLVLISCLDNLLKGAAGQAVQNMNVMYGWPEAEGLL